MKRCCRSGIRQRPATLTALATDTLPTVTVLGLAGCVVGGVIVVAVGASVTLKRNRSSEMLAVPKEASGVVEPAWLLIQSPLPVTVWLYSKASGVLPPDNSPRKTG